jgi:uncharacterized membrane protein YidH (DUF202 family)
MSDASDHEYGLITASDINFNFAIMAIFAWWVPVLSIEIGCYRESLLKSPDWKDHKLQEGLSAVLRWSGYAIIHALLLIVVLAIMIGLLTKHLHESMYSILKGLSLLSCALLLFVMSIYTPKWSGVDFFRGLDLVRVEKVGNNLKVLRFNVFWGVSRQFARVGFFLLPFFCGVAPQTIPLSALAGIGFGLVVDAFVYFSRRTKTQAQRNHIAITTAVVIALLSGVLFAGGVYYISFVWREDDEGNDHSVILYSFVAWTVTGIFVHVLLWYYAKTKYALQENEVCTRPCTSSKRPHMATSTVSFII